MAANEVAVWIAGVSAAISIFALWRSGRARVLDMRTALRKDLVERRLALDELTKTIHFAVTSRLLIGVASGGGGAFEQFREEASVDTKEAEALRQKLAGIEPIAVLVGYNTIEAKMLVAHEVRTRVEYLTQKYKLAAAADDEARLELRRRASADTSSH